MFPTTELAGGAYLAPTPYTFEMNEWHFLHLAKGVVHLISLLETLFLGSFPLDLTAQWISHIQMILKWLPNFYLTVSWFQSSFRSFLLGLHSRVQASKRLSDRLFHKGPGKNSTGAGSVSVCYKKPVTKPSPKTWCGGHAGDRRIV